jgi:PAS domain S-box-containing protein
MGKDLPAPPVSLDGAPFGVLCTDEHGCCTHTNAAWQDICGLTLAESLGDGRTRGLPPDDREVVAHQWLADAESGRPFDLVFRVLCKDGIGRRARARAWSVPGGTIGTVEDVTEAEARAQQLRSTAQLLDRTGQIAGVGAWDIDLRTREVRWSTQTYRIYERPLDWRPGIEDGMDYCAPEARRNATDELHASRERLGLVREAVVGAPATGLLHGQPAERREALACVRERLHAQGGIEGLAGEPGSSRRRGLAHADVGRGGARCRRAQRSAAGRVRGHLRDRAAAGRTGAQRAGLDGVQAGAGAGRPRCRPRA